MEGERTREPYHWRASVPASRRGFQPRIPIMQELFGRAALRLAGTLALQTPKTHYDIPKVGLGVPSKGPLRSGRARASE